MNVKPGFFISTRRPCLIVVWLILSKCVEWIDVRRAVCGHEGSEQRCHSTSCFDRIDRCRTTSWKETCQQRRDDDQQDDAAVAHRSRGSISGMPAAEQQRRRRCDEAHEAAQDNGPGRLRDDHADHRGVRAPSAMRTPISGAVVPPNTRPVRRCRPPTARARSGRWSKESPTARRCWPSSKSTCVIDATPWIGWFDRAPRPVPESPARAEGGRRQPTSPRRRGPRSIQVRGDEHLRKRT